MTDFILCATDDNSLGSCEPSDYKVAWAGHFEVFEVLDAFFVGLYVEKTVNNCISLIGPRNIQIVVEVAHDLLMRGTCCPLPHIIAY